MKNYTNAELKAILQDLKNGQPYCAIKKMCGVLTGTGCIMYTIQKGKPLIYWRHAGDSYNKATIKNLRWLLETIFDDCVCVAPAVYNVFYVNYIPKSPTYAALDYNMLHNYEFGKSVSFCCNKEFFQTDIFGNRITPKGYNIL